MRKPHILKALTTGMTRLRILFFDVETRTIKIEENKRYQEFRMVCAVLTEYRPGQGWFEQERFESLDREEFYAWFDSILLEKNILYIITANIWFDMRNSGLIFHMVRRGFVDKIFFMKGMTNIYKFTLKKYTVVCLNMQQFIPVSVKAMGDMLGLKKLDIDLNSDSNEDVMKYCMRDVKIIQKMFEQWIKFLVDQDMGKFSYTLAGQAFTAFRYRFMRRKIFIHGSDFLTDFERKAYTGGRVEIFHQGEIKGKKLYKLDVNSMYPYMMKTHKMPVKWIDTYMTPTNATLWYLLKKYICIAEVAINTDIPAYPCKHNGKLVFPIGRFVTHLSHPELEMAYKNNDIYSIRYVICYNRSIVFREYVEHFHELKSRFKSENDAVFTFIAKRLMNSLYGKLAQRIDREIVREEIAEERYEINTIIDEKTGETFREVYFGHCRRVFRENDKDGRETFVAIAAHITSLARRYLWELILQAGRKNVYYCDTDSLFVNQCGRDNLTTHIDPSMLGKLAIEDESEKLIIHCPKDYVFGDTTKIKGVRRDAAKRSDGSYDQIQFPGFKGDMMNGFEKPYAIRDVNKTLKRVYDKGIVLPDGSVKPLSLQEY